MRKSESILLFSVLVLFLLLVSFANASSVSSSTQVYYFHGDGCPHCANVDASGVLERISVPIEKYEIYHNDTSAEFFKNITSQLDAPQGIPLAVIQCGDNYAYLAGDTPIIDDLQNYIDNCETLGKDLDGGINTSKITLWAIIIAALVDSINPCAFSVLIFLMISLLKMGSSKRALKAGLLYTLVVFSVYFLSGFGLFKVIQQFTSITHYIYLASGILVILIGLLQIKDLFWYGKGISVRIPPSAKPIMEKIIHKGTIPAIMLLGIVVSLFELPCTGGIYVGILTLMSINKSFSLFYLLIYNLIFVLPLVVLTLAIYKGTSPETLSKWTTAERSWMKLAAAVVLIALGIYILFF